MRIQSIILVLSLALNAYLLYTLDRYSPPRDVRSDQHQAPVAQTSSTPGVLTGTYPFLRVVDGDTIAVGAPGGTEYVRLIGIDAPEPNDPGGPECYANEATAHLRELITTGSVTLVIDETQGARDKYNRILAYVELPDGIDVGERMLADGYVHEYTYNMPYERLDRYKAAEQRAVSEERGLWAASACAL